MRRIYGGFDSCRMEVGPLNLSRANLQSNPGLTRSIDVLLTTPTNVGSSDFDSDLPVTVWWGASADLSVTNIRYSSEILIEYFASKLLDLCPICSETAIAGIYNVPVVQKD